MSRYIDANSLKIRLGIRFNTDKRRIMEIVKDTVDSMPTDDVVEVVRCKDCTWFDDRYDVCHNPRWGDGWGNYPPPSVNEDRFCCDGERREDGATEMP